MHNLDRVFNKINSVVVGVVIFLTPLFFLPITRDFVIYSKFYFFLYAILFLIVLSFVKLLLTKKLYWVRNPFFQSFILLLLAYALSIILMSPNKFQALLQPHFGLLAVVGMVGFYLYFNNVLSNDKKISPMFYLALSGFVTSIVAIVFMIEPFKNTKLPANLSFLQNAYFNTVGNQFELLSFLIFVLAGVIVYVYRMKNDRESDSKDKSLMYGLFIFFMIIAAGLELFNIVKALTTQGGQIVLTPLSQSWYAAVEVLKNPMTALFGVGVDNFPAVFTRVKDLSYNASNLWQITTFQVSRSALLHLFTEVGLIGLIAFGLVVGKAMQYIKSVRLETAALFIVSIIILVVLPPSFMSLFMFFFSIALMSHEIRQHKSHEVFEVDFSQIVPLYVGIVVIYLLALGTGGYFITKNFVSELYFKKAIDAVAKNSMQELYENQRKAIENNLYNEDFHISFAQTNLLLANNLATKKPEEVTEADRQTIAEAIQVAIQEAKTAVALNPQKVTNWQNLAGVYRSLLNVAQGAEEWTVSAYQRAILMDPQNPVYRLELGGVFYLYGNYDEAQKLFEQAVSLKPDWANAHYNLAWTYYQKKQFQAAVSEMETVLRSIDPKAAEGDYKRAQQELAEFKKALPAPAEGEEQAAVEPEDLNLPSPPPATVEPKISLPADASPESEEVAQ